jgi:hypothetical protein
MVATEESRDPHNDNNSNNQDDTNNDTPQGLSGHEYVPFDPQNWATVVEEYMESLLTQGVAARTLSRVENHHLQHSIQVDKQEAALRQMASETPSLARLLPCGAHCAMDVDRGSSRERDRSFACDRLRYHLEVSAGSSGWGCSGDRAGAGSERSGRGTGREVQ